MVTLFRSLSQNFSHFSYYTTGPQHLLRPLQLLHQNCVYTCPTPIQEAVAIGFETEIARMDNPDSYWKELANMLEPKRLSLITKL